MCITIYHTSESFTSLASTSHHSQIFLYPQVMVLSCYFRVLMDDLHTILTSRFLISNDFLHHTKSKPPTMVPIQHPNCSISEIIHVDFLLPDHVIFIDCHKIPSRLNMVFQVFHKIKIWDIHQKCNYPQAPAPPSNISLFLGQNRSLLNICFKVKHSLYVYANNGLVETFNNSGSQMQVSIVWNFKTRQGLEYLLR